ncbi:MAG: family 10 glycosylhydrolase [Bacteroidaceae bacterium]|nr:family 10 glycosylhydrolase [Bacteroidaceae bacterium]
MRRIISLFSILCIVCTSMAQPLWDSRADIPKRELRAVWVTTLSGLDWPKTKATSQFGIEQQKRELCQLLDQLKACHINTILLQTRVRGSVIYPSAIEPWDQCLTGQFDRSPGYDPLAFAIEETHRRGMELHAWVVTIPAFKVEVAKRMGRRSLLSTHPDLLKKYNGQYYLDPGLPGTADYLSAVVAEIVSKYDVDGIHFDYIRYPENAASFPDGTTYKKYGQGKNKTPWRRDNVTTIVRRLYKEVKSHKPWVVMSSSPVGKYRDTHRYSSKGWNCFDAVHQDAQGWLREGIQDALFPMMYFTGDHFYPFAVDWQEGSYGRHVAPGLGIYFLHPQEKNWSLDVITRELFYLRQNGLAGQAYFRSRFLTDDVKGIYGYLRNTFYAYPALPPQYQWSDSIPPTKPDGFTLAETGNPMGQLCWHPSTDNQQGGVRYNVYASSSFPVDTSRPENLVAMLLPSPCYTYNRVTTLLCGLHLAVTAIDRSGNESEPAQLALPERKTPTRIPLNPLGKRIH